MKLPDVPHSLEELKTICGRLEDRIEAATGVEREDLQQLLAKYHAELVALQKTMLGKLEGIVHDPRLEGSAPPLVPHSKFGEWIVRILQKLGVKKP